MGKKLRRWLMKKMYNKVFFYEDPAMGTEFYMGFTEFYDITILMVDVNSGTLREFLTDFKTLRQVYMFVEHGTISPNPLDNKVEKPLHIVKNYTTRDNMQIILAAETKMYGSTVLGKVMEIQRGEDEVEKVLSLKRVAYLPVMKNSVLGIDTMAIPQEAAGLLIEKIKKLFKSVDIETDLSGGSNAVN
jgi:hypothetical protein